MLYWRLAFRNLFRNRGRLILNLLLLVAAFSTIVCFKGFKTHVLETMQRLMIGTQFGSFQVAKQSFFDNAPVDQTSDKMIANSGEIIQKISQIKGVKFVSPRVSFFGLINTEDKSMTTHFVGFNPSVEDDLQKNIIMLKGQTFIAAKDAIVSPGLEANLKVKPGDDVTIVSPTLAGGINAMDITVHGIFSSGFTDIDASTVFINLSDAQKILDSDLVDQILVRIDDPSQLNAIMSRVREIVAPMGLAVKSWYDLAELFRQVENFYDFQNLFIEVIILLLLFLSVANTVSMTVFERLGEIGTLRALGDYETDIQRLFLFESILLGVFAIVLGIPFSIFLQHFVSTLNIPIVLPMASQPLPFEISPNIGSYLESATICMLAVVISSLWPARRGADTSIVVALGAKV